MLELASDRANIVHGEMILVDIDGQRFAIFRNARESANNSQTAALHSYKAICDLAAKVDRASDALVSFKVTSSNPIRLTENVTSISA